MKILYLCHRTPFPPNKGERIRTFHQIEYLHRKGHEISVFAPTFEATDADNLKALEAKYCERTFHAPAPGKLALVKALLSGSALSVNNFYSRALQQQLDEFISAHTVDAIVCTSSSMAAYVFRSKAIDLTGGQHPTLVMDFMDLDSDKWRQYQSLKGLPLSLIYGREAKLIAALEQKIHNHFDACLLISQAEVDLFLHTINDTGKLHVVANGLDTEAFQPSTEPKPETGPVLLFTGVMDYLPNEDAVAWFVESAWTKLKQAHPDAVFYIAGMNPSSRVKALAKYPGVEVTGFVDDIRTYYDRAHIFVAPFRLARGVQNKVLQAFACALPTITTPMGCEGINCEAGKEVLVADTVEAMLKHIDWVIANPDQAQQLGTNAMRLIQDHFSWDSQLACFESLLQPAPSH